MNENMMEHEIELTEEDKRILEDPVKVFSIMQRLKKVRRIAPQINRYQFALQKTLQLMKYINSFLSDYNIKYSIETLDDRINVNISIGIYSEKATPKDEYIYTFTVLRKAFPDLSDAMIHRLTKDVLGRRIKFISDNRINIDDSQNEVDEV